MSAYCKVCLPVKLLSIRHFFMIFHVLQNTVKKQINFQTFVIQNFLVYRLEPINYCYKINLYF